jgi:Prokaryotic RING finger family 1
MPQELLLAILSALGGFALGLVWHRLRARKEPLDPLVAETRRFTGFRYARGRLEGALVSGRPAAVRFLPHGEDVAWVELSVAVRGAPELTVTEGNALTKLGQQLGWAPGIGDRRFDARFVVKTSEDLPVRKALEAGLKRTVERVFRYGAEELSFEGSSVTATVRTSRIHPDEYLEMLRLLEQAASLFDRVLLNVRVLGGVRAALVDEKGTLRCAYCHAGLTGDEDALVACERCRTVLHEGCWKENGHCPVLGCSGREPERARVA